MIFDIQETINRLEVSQKIGAEAGMSLTEHIDSVSDGIAKFYKDVMNTDAVGIALSPVQDASLVSELNKEGFSNIRRLAVYTPFRLEGYAEDFYAILLDQLGEMVNVQQRLYDPAIRLLGKLLTDPEAYEKAWIDRELKFTDVGKMTKELSTLMTDKKTNTGDPDKQEFQETYKSAKHFGEGFKILQAIKDTGDILDLETLRKREDRMMELVRRFVKGYDDVDVTLNAPLATKLIRTFDAIALETEYLAALLYYANICIKAHNDTVEQLNANY